MGLSRKAHELVEKAAKHMASATGRTVRHRDRHCVYKENAKDNQSTLRTKECRCASRKTDFKGEPMGGGKGDRKQKLLLVSGSVRRGIRRSPGKETRPLRGDLATSQGGDCRAKLSGVAPSRWQGTYQDREGKRLSSAPDAKKK